MATNYRAVCPICTGYIRSDSDEETTEEWLARAYHWVRHVHVCGDGTPEDYENENKGPRSLSDIPWSAIF